MKLAYVVDACAQDSFYVKDGVAYDFVNNKPYAHNRSINPSLTISSWNFPFLFGDGCFLNLFEWVTKDLDFPDYDLDIILYGCERAGLDNETKHLYSIDRLRKKYPNAKIVGWAKEQELSVHNREVRYQNWMSFFKECDTTSAHGITTMKELTQWRQIENDCGRKFNFISCPININPYYDLFYSDHKEESLYAYLPNPMHRRGETYKFVSYLSEKYNIPSKFKPLGQNQKFDHIEQFDFIKLWSPSIFHFNLDPAVEHPGHQTIQVANVGSINIGGKNESHFLLYPETATCDLDILENKFVEYLNDVDKRFEVISYAWENLNKYYSFEVVREQIKELYDKN
tara:strand:- start:594 stop:1616 length:1023 start_codon:yes stop_codon:yes gene_type:complete